MFTPYQSTEFYEKLRHCDQRYLHAVRAGFKLKARRTARHLALLQVNHELASAIEDPASAKLAEVRTTVDHVAVHLETIRAPFLPFPRLEYVGDTADLVSTYLFWGNHTKIVEFVDKILPPSTPNRRRPLTVRV